MGYQAADYSEKCTKLGLETLEARRKRQDMALVHIKYCTWLFVKTGRVSPDKADSLRT
jgi:hypothetical protein